jgi:hypothetical protein
MVYKDKLKWFIYKQKQAKRQRKQNVFLKNKVIDYSKTPCKSIVLDNLNLVKAGKELNAPLRWLNTSCQFRKKYYDLIIRPAKFREYYQSHKEQRREYRQRKKDKLYKEYCLKIMMLKEEILISMTRELHSLGKIKANFPKIGLLAFKEAIEELVKEGKITKEVYGRRSKQIRYRKVIPETMPKDALASPTQAPTEDISGKGVISMENRQNG